MGLGARTIFLRGCANFPVFWLFWRPWGHPLHYLGRAIVLDSIFVYPRILLCNSFLLLKGELRGADPAAINTSIPMNAPPLPPHIHAVGLGDRQNITVFDNLGVDHAWSYNESKDAFGRALWVATLVAFPIDNHAGGQTHYVGSGPKKAYAKDEAACHYLVRNRVVPAPPLAP